MSSIALDKLEYLGWKNCLRLSNGTVELIITTEVGPRIIHYGFVNEKNELCVWEEQAGLTGGDTWRCYGGSRLWHGPEIGKRCYEPDNEAVEWEADGNGVILKQKTESWTKIAKQIKVSLEETGSKVHFDFEIRNESPWKAELCIWILTLMEKGGVCVLPAHKQIKGIAPNSVMPIGAIAFWPYTSLADSRFEIGENYYILRHDPSNSQNFKIGLPIFEGWAAYANGGHLFIKRFPYIQGVQYPDYSSQVELYCCERYTELESLSPMKTLDCMETLAHKESWELYRNVPSLKDEEEINKTIRSIINQA